MSDDPEKIQVEIEEEAPKEEGKEEAPKVEEAPKEEVKEEAPKVEEAPKEEVKEEAPKVEEAKVEDAPDIKNVVSDLRNILNTPVEVKEETASVEVKEDNILNQRIAELDYLRECCGNWVGSGRRGKSEFLKAWENKSVSVDLSVNYEEKLHELEKLPEIVKLWAERKVTSESNHFKNIESYTLSKPLFNDKSVEEKVEVVEKLINLLINCANGKMRVTQIEEVIDNLY